MDLREWRKRQREQQSVALTVRRQLREHKADVSKNRLYAEWKAYRRNVDGEDDSTDEATLELDRDVFRGVDVVRDDEFVLSSSRRVLWRCTKDAVYCYPSINPISLEHARHMWPVSVSERNDNPFDIVTLVHIASYLRPIELHHTRMLSRLWYYACTSDAVWSRHYAFLCGFFCVPQDLRRTKDYYKSYKEQFPVIPPRALRDAACTKDFLERHPRVIMYVARCIISNSIVQTVTRQQFDATFECVDLKCTNNEHYFLVWKKGTQLFAFRNEKIHLKDMRSRWYTGYNRVVMAASIDDLSPYKWPSPIIPVLN